MNTDLKKPYDMPQKRWDSLSLRQKLWWMDEAERYGGYEEVVNVMKDRRSRRKNKLTEEQVEEIRDSAQSLSVLAKEYGVTSSYISYVKSGKRG